MNGGRLATSALCVLLANMEPLLATSQCNSLMQCDGRGNLDGIDEDTTALLQLSVQQEFKDDLSVAPKSNLGVAAKVNLPKALKEEVKEVEAAPKSDVRSAGCGRASPLGVTEFQLLHGGLQRTYTILTPHDYRLDSPRSVIVGFHEHDHDPDEIVKGPMAQLASEPNGPIIVAPYGVYTAGLPASFNGAGSTGSPGPDGPTCGEGAEQYTCHQTCGLCQRCWWTSCADDVGYVLAVLDQVEASFCVRSDQVYATGFSGGGQFTFEIATDPRSAHRFEAVAPLSGLPHNGFLKAPDPSIAPRLLGMWEGMWEFKWPIFQDQSYPPFSNVKDRPDKSQDTNYGPKGGFFYSTAANTTGLWAQTLCFSSQDSAVKYVGGNVQGFHSELSCKSRCAGQVIECLRASDKHQWAMYQPKLVWEFFQGNGIFQHGLSVAQKRRRSLAFVRQASGSMPSDSPGSSTASTRPLVNSM